MKPALDVIPAELQKRLRVAIYGRGLLFLGAVLTVALVLLPEVNPMSPGPSERVALVVFGAVLVSNLLASLISRRGRRLEEVSIVLIVLDQLLWTAIVFISGGVVSGATSLYGLTCLLGGFVLGVPGVFAAALAGGVFFSLMVLLIESGGLVIPSDQIGLVYQPSGVQTTYYMVVNLLVLVLVALLASYLAERQKRTSGALIAAETRAREAERLAALGQLAAGLAHEIRNPLSSIASAVQLLKTGVKDQEDRQLCEIVLRESGRLEDLVSDMLNLSRPRAKELNLTDVALTVRDVVQLSAHSGRAHGDVEVIRSGLSGPLYVLADSAQLKQLVWNLVRNAVQASAPGNQVIVELGRVGDRVILSVLDQGVGIDELAQARLFDAFYSTRSQGTGLGLAVVKRIADDHGFSISVESGEGKGAAFHVDLGPGQDQLPEFA